MGEIEVSASVRTARQRLILIAAFMLAIAIVPGRPWAQQAEPAADGLQKAKIEQFLKLPSDPEIQAYLQMQTQAAPAGPTLTEREMEVEKSAGALLSQRLMQIRSHIREMAAAIPRAPGEIAEAAWKVREARNGNWGALALFAGFILAGLAAEWIFRRLLSVVKHRSETTMAHTPRHKSVRLLVRFLIGAGSTGVFALASPGSFLAFSWTRLLHVRRERHRVRLSDRQDRWGRRERLVCEDRRGAAGDGAKGDRPAKVGRPVTTPMDTFNMQKGWNL